MKRGGKIQSREIKELTLWKFVRIENERRREEKVKGFENGKLNETQSHAKTHCKLYLALTAQINALSTCLVLMKRQEMITDNTFVT